MRGRTPIYKIEKKRTQNMVEIWLKEFWFQVEFC